MKKLLLLSIIALLSVFAFSACTSDDDDILTTADLAGSYWVMSQSKPYTLLKFNGNSGSCIHVGLFSDKGISLNYTISGNCLNIKVTGSTDSPVRNGQITNVTCTRSGKRLKISGDSYVSGSYEGVTE